MRYIYTGSKDAQRLAEAGFDIDLRAGEECDPICHSDGRVVRCISAGISNALVRFSDGKLATVSPRRLRLKSKTTE